MEMIVLKELVNIDNWKRKKQYNFFIKYSDPYAAVSSIIDVDNIVRHSKNNNISFYGIMSYLVLKSINEIDEFKYFMYQNGVYKYDKVNTSFTVLKNDKSLNFSRTVEYNDFPTFILDFIFAKHEAESDAIIEYDKNNNNLAYITCLPWMRFTSVMNPKNGVDSNPRVCWGKYFVNNGRYLIDVSIQINHAFIDGYHIGLFFQLLQENISRFMETQNEEYCLHRLR